MEIAQELREQRDARKFRQLCAEMENRLDSGEIDGSLIPELEAVAKLLATEYSGTDAVLKLATIPAASYSLGSTISYKVDSLSVAKQTFEAFRNLFLSRRVVFLHRIRRSSLQIPSLQVLLTSVFGKNLTDPELDDFLATVGVGRRNRV